MSEDSMLSGSQDGGTPPAAADNSGGEWVGGLPDDLKGLAEHKGWKEPVDALKGYQQLESFMGADKAGRGVVLPKDAEDAEGYERVYKALGRPDSPEGYDLNSVLGDYEVNEEFMGTMAGAMHKAGLSAKQAQELAAAYRDLEVSQMEAGLQGRKAELEAAMREIPQETQEQARRGLRFLGLPEDEHVSVAKAVEQALGFKRAAEIFARFGRALGEDSPPSDGRAVGAFGSPEAAKRRMDQLMADAAFSQRYLSGDQSALGEIEELSRRVTAAGI